MQTPDLTTLSAHRHSGWFRRAVVALQGRPLPGFDSLRILGRWCEALPDADGLLAVALEAARAAAHRSLGLPGAPAAGTAGEDACAMLAGEGLDDAAVAAGLRRARQLLLMATMQRDVDARASLDEVCEAFTALADAATAVALRRASRTAAARFGTPVDAAGVPMDLLAIVMGKGGARELNVSSDLDLVFVCRTEGTTRGGQVEIAAGDFMHRVAREVLRLIGDTTEDGFVFRVDTRLRPHGDSGPLVVSLDMLEHYLLAEGREWERFAWLKARPAADGGLSGPQRVAEDLRQLDALVRPFVFRRYLDFGAFASLRALHAKIRDEMARRDARRDGWDCKLGRGGIREIEFIAQLFQVVRGGRDPGLRDPHTLGTLARLPGRGLMDGEDAAALADAYRFLRRLEHALQYREDEQTHRLPPDPAVREQVAAMLGLAAPDFEAALAAHRERVHRVFDRLLAPSAPVPTQTDAAGNGGAGAAPAADAAVAGPAATAGAPTESDAALEEEIDTRLRALRDGSRYRAASEDTQQRIEHLLHRARALVAPRAIDPAESSPAPAALGRLVDLLEAVCRRPGYIALLDRHPVALARVLRLIGRARWAAEYLTRHPIVLDELLDGQLLEPVSYRAWGEDVRALLAQTVHGGEPDVERQMDAMREAHHAQVFRLLAQDLEGTLPLERLSDHLSDLADEVLAIALELVWSQLRKRFRDAPRFAVIAYGKLGGRELGYASDLDLVFLYDDDDERAPEAYALLAQRLSGWLSTRTAAGIVFDIDLRLRPNGNAGLLVSSTRAFADYQHGSAWLWEHQALTRARFAVGDPRIGAWFEAERRTLLARPREASTLRTEVIAMRARMLDGHPNRSGLFDLKHDRGGMVDIEFVVQTLVLGHAARVPALLDNAGNIALLGRAAQAGLIDATLARRTADAYRRYRREQHALRLEDLEYARIDPDAVIEERRAVLALWNAVLGDETPLP